MSLTPLNEAEVSTLLTDNGNQAAAEVTSASSFGNTSFIITLSYVLGAAFAVMIASSWDTTLTLGFSKIGLNPGAASITKSIFITIIGVTATIFMNKIANWWANWKSLPSSSPSPSPPPTSTPNPPSNTTSKPQQPQQQPVY